MHLDFQNYGNYWELLEAATKLTDNFFDVKNASEYPWIVEAKMYTGKIECMNNLESLITFQC